MSVFGSLQKSFVAGLIRKLFRVKIINPENEPLESDVKSYVACINHSSNWDPIVIGACMHRPLRYMAKGELFRVPVLKSIVKLFGAYPVQRDKADVSSVKMTISILESGEVVGMYPQGRRAKKIPPENITLKSGVAMMAVKAKTGILPVTVISKGYKVRIFHKTTVVFGKYITFEELEEFRRVKQNEESSIDLYKRITEKVYSEILENYRRYDDLNDLSKKINMKADI